MEPFPPRAFHFVTAQLKSTMIGAWNSNSTVIIDHVLLRGPLLENAVVGGRRTYLKRRDGMHLSDHTGVAAVFDEARLGQLDGVRMPPTTTSTTSTTLPPTTQESSLDENTTSDGVGRYGFFGWRTLLVLFIVNVMGGGPRMGGRAGVRDYIVS